MPTLYKKISAYCKHFYFHVWMWLLRMVEATIEAPHPNFPSQFTVLRGNLTQLDGDVVLSTILPWY